MNSAYADHVKPLLAEVLTALGLDVSYQQAKGDWLFYQQQGESKAVLDLLGGYGSLIFGHNHPELIATAHELLEQNLAIHSPFSLREGAGLLGQELNRIARRETDYEFISAFANTGAEAIELAIKHAELERILKVSALLDEITLNIEQVRQQLRTGQVRVAADIYEHSEIREQQFDVGGFDELIVGLINHNSAQLQQRPVFLALEKAFHGKLAGSVQLTYNKNFRRPFQYFGLKTRFVPMNQPEQLAEILRQEQRELFDLVIQDGQVQLQRRPLPIFSALLVEPIQGEGGIHELTADSARVLRKFCSQQDIPLIVDEIQSGMGRCGRFFASSQIGLKGDYYCLSKSLGGGLAKVSATLIRRDRYQREFGLIHSSTFAEDEFSSRLGLKVLAMLEADNGAAYRQIEQRGHALKSMLLALQAEYPDQIAAVRGRGLFLGVEFIAPAQAESQIIRAAVYSDSLGYFISGYLLRQEGIRISPTGSAPNVLRLEPSLLLSDAAIDQLRSALQRVCQILRYQDSLHLVYPLCGSQRALPRSEIRDFRGALAYQPLVHRSEPLRPVRKVAFINHLIGPEWLRQVDPALAELNNAELREFVLKMAAGKKSAPYPAVRIQSALGTAVDFILYPLCAVSEQMGQWLSSGDLSEIRSDVEERVKAAAADGCELAGLGMYTSIVTNNCTALAVPEMGLTSGNALTLAMSIQAMERAAAELHLDWSTTTVAVIGAAGNIASTYASMLAERAAKLILIGSGRDGSKARVLKTLYSLYEDCWQLIQTEAPATLQGIPARLIAEPLIQSWQNHGAPAQDRGQLIHQALVARYGSDPLVSLSQDPADARHAQAVLCAANAPAPFLDLSHFAPGSLVCDVAVPCNLLPEAAQSDQIHYLQGGIVATPHGESLHPGARAFLGSGQLFACMAETVILGLSGLTGHYSYGAISRQQVREIAALAELHGFGLADAKRGNSL